jgi:hypothetical protein
VWSSNWFSTNVAYLSADLCTLPLFLDVAVPVVGMYCGAGSIAGTNATAFILPNGNLYMALYALAPTNQSYQSGACEAIGTLSYSRSTGFASYLAAGQSNCRFQPSTDSAPRVRISSTWYDNKTGVFSLRGSTWTAPNGDGMPITYTLSAGADCFAQGQSSNASLPFYPRGVYAVDGAGLNVTALVLGSRLAVYAANLEHRHAEHVRWPDGGIVRPNTLSAAASSAGVTATLANAQFGVNGVHNATFVPDLFQLSLQWAYSANTQGGHLALPLSYRGFDPASAFNPVLTTTTMMPNSTNTALHSEHRHHHRPAAATDRCSSHHAGCGAADLHLSHSGESERHFRVASAGAAAAGCGRRHPDDGSER